MIRKLICLFCLLILTLPACAAQKVDESLHTNTIEISDCGTIKIDLTSWVQLYDSGFIIYHPSVKDVNPTPDVQFTFKCYSANDENVIDNTIVSFNDTTQLWELNPDLLSKYKDKNILESVKKLNKVYQLKAKNAQGWILTHPSMVGNYPTRELLFCLIDKLNQKALCGSGDVEYFPDDPDVTKINYEPIVLKFLKSIEFISENK